MDPHKDLYVDMTRLWLCTAGQSRNLRSVLQGQIQTSDGF